MLYRFNNKRFLLKLLLINKSNRKYTFQEDLITFNININRNT